MIGSIYCYICAVCLNIVLNYSSKFVEAFVGSVNVFVRRKLENINLCTSSWFSCFMGSTVKSAVKISKVYAAKSKIFPFGQGSSTSTISININVSVNPYGSYSIISISVTTWVYPVCPWTNTNRRTRTGPNRGGMEPVSENEPQEPNRQFAGTEPKIVVIFKFDT